MSNCPKCDYTLEEGARECPVCGVVLAKVRGTASGRFAAPPPSGPVEGAAAEPAAEPGAGVAPSPYAPPLAPVQPPRGTAAAMGGERRVTDLTLESLEKVRPWLRFLVVYGFIMLAIMVLGAIGMFFAGVNNPALMPLSLVYFFYAWIFLAVLLPLNRSAQALRQLATLGPARGLEGFVTHQAAFWRRAGILSAVMLVLIVLAMGVAVIAGILAAASR